MQSKIAKALGVLILLSGQLYAGDVRDNRIKFDGQGDVMNVHILDDLRTPLERIRQALMNGATFWDDSGTNIYNTNTGNVGVGTLSPSEKLDVYGTIGVSGSSVSASGGNFRISAPTVTVPGNLVSYNAVTAWGTAVGTTNMTLDMVGISSIAFVSTGIWRITLARPFANSNYAATCQPMVNLTVTHMTGEVDAPGGSVPKTPSQYGCRFTSMPGGAETNPFQFFTMAVGRVQ